MKVPQLFALLIFATGSFINPAYSLAWQSKPLKENNAPKPKPKNPSAANRPTYNFHEASTLSGITLQPDKSSGSVILRFDQQLTEPGTLLVKNNSGKVLYSNLLQPAKERITHTLNIGRLIPGLYTVEVKTTATTFWKKVRVRN